MPATANDQSRPIVLVVQGDTGTRDVFRQVLRSAGYTVLVAGSAEEADRVSEAHPGPVDLLLTDADPGRMPAADLIRPVLARYPGARVLFASGDPAADRVRPAAGARWAVLGKPFGPMTLAAAVAAMIGPARPLRRG